MTQTNENIEYCAYISVFNSKTLRQDELATFIFSLSVTHSPLYKCKSSLANDKVIQLKHDYWLIWNTMLVFQFFCFLSHMLMHMFSQISWLLSTAIFLAKSHVIWTQVILGNFYREKTIPSEAELNGKKMRYLLLDR